MPRPPRPDPLSLSDEPLTPSGSLDASLELEDEDFEVVDPAGDLPAGDEPLRRPLARRRLLVAGAAVAAVTLVAGGLVGYRLQHRRAVLRDGLARADALLRLDTAAGYRDAAALLEPLAELDPLQAGSTRALALAMLAADYRDEAAARDANAQLVEPMRASAVPPRAQAATAALALGRREAGNAMTAVIRAGDSPEASLVAARVAILAGNLGAAEETLAAAAGGDHPAALALRGDVLRRTRRDLGAARAAYSRALSVSPLHPRAAYGLAKLALSGHATPAEAEAALRRLLDDAEHTPAPERGRAALHLSALRLRAGDRGGAERALAAATLDPAARGWAERAAQAEASQRGHYRAVEGAPAAIRSASDDDPPVIAPLPLQRRRDPPAQSTRRSAKSGGGAKAKRQQVAAPQRAAKPRAGATRP